MSALSRYIVDAVVLEHRSPSQLARDHGISKRWIFKLLQRFKEGGYPALEPRSRRPKSSPQRIEARVQDLIVELRRELAAAGHDAGPQTIAYHLQSRLEQVPSVAQHLADPEAARLGHSPAAQATTGVVHPFRSQAAQRDLAG